MKREIERDWGGFGDRDERELKRHRELKRQIADGCRHRSTVVGCGRERERSREIGVGLGIEMRER